MKKLMRQLLITAVFVLAMTVPAFAAKVSLPTTKDIHCCYDEITLENAKNPVTWKTSNKTIVCVRGTTKGRAVLRGIEPGKATITATTVVGKTEKTFTCAITVTDINKLSKKKMGLYVGNAATLTVQNAQYRMKWKSSDSSVVSVYRQNNTQARVVAFKPGKATITAYYGSHMAYTCKVTSVVKPKEKTFKIAIAAGGQGTESVIAVLRGLGVQCSVVTDCNPNNYDGLIIPGGADIDPSLYGEGMSGASRNGMSINNDKMQVRLLKKFMAVRKPVFGICRGMQLINVAMGGTLNQNIRGHYGMKDIKVVRASSLPGKTYGLTNVAGNHQHHQSIKRLASGLVKTMVREGTIEGIEGTVYPVYAVQWHPETSGGQGTKLMKAFVNVCKAHRAGR